MIVDCCEDILMRYFYTENQEFRVFFEEFFKKKFPNIKRHGDPTKGTATYENDGVIYTIQRTEDGNVIFRSTVDSSCLCRIEFDHSDPTKPVTCTYYDAGLIVDRVNVEHKGEDFYYYDEEATSLILDERKPEDLIATEEMVNAGIIGRIQQLNLLPDVKLWSGKDNANNETFVLLDSKSGDPLDTQLASPYISNTSIMSRVSDLQKGILYF